jgi:hypothetical protein
MNIFDISKELLDIFQELEENGGELTDELESRLAITQADFQAKVKSYTDVIKYTNAEIDLIDKEIARLKSLKESKNKAIDRLESIVIWAVSKFGDTTKAGNKFIDFGTGKVTVRNSEKVEVDTDIADTVVKNVFSYLNMLNFTKELNYTENINSSDVVKAIGEMENPVNITEEEFNNIDASLSINFNLKKLLDSKGIEFTKQFLNFVQSYKTKSNISKTALKPILEKNEVDLHNIASLVHNQTLSIK